MFGDMHNSRDAITGARNIAHHPADDLQLDLTERPM